MRARGPEDRASVATTNVKQHRGVFLHDGVGEGKGLEKGIHQQQGGHQYWLTVFRTESNICATAHPTFVRVSTDDVNVCVPASGVGMSLKVSEQDAGLFSLGADAST